MKQFFTAGLFALSVTCLVGCGSNEPSNTMEGASEQEVLDYDAMIEADNAMMADENIGDEDAGE